MKLSIAYYDHPVLRQKAERVDYIDNQLRQLVHDMLETMHATKGIGLAAPQIFQSIALFVSCVPIQGEDGRWYRGKNKVFLNPQILKVSTDMQTTSEGCLSIPELYVDITRPLTIEVESTNLVGQKIQETMSGLEAANFMHEYDHLQGILTIDRLSAEESEKIAAKLEEIKAKYKT